MTTRVPHQGQFCLAVYSLPASPNPVHHGYGRSGKNTLVLISSLEFDGATIEIPRGRFAKIGSATHARMASPFGADHKAKASLPTAFPEPATIRSDIAAVWPAWRTSAVRMASVHYQSKSPLPGSDDAPNASRRSLRMKHRQSHRAQGRFQKQDALHNHPVVRS